MKHLSVILAAAAVMAAAAACGGSSSDAASAPSSSAAVASAPAPSSPASGAPASSGTTSAPAATSAPALVAIKDFAFTVPTTVAAGATVRVTNADAVAHTVTADSGGAFDTMVTSKGSASFTAPAKPGRYPFHCTYHSNMHGVLVVA